MAIVLRSRWPIGEAGALLLCSAVCWSEVSFRGFGVASSLRGLTLLRHRRDLTSLWRSVATQRSSATTRSFGAVVSIEPAQLS